MGTKVFNLYPPSDVRHLYFEPIAQDYQRSWLAFPDVDYRKNPLARKLTRIEVTLGPGDAMYLPVHWAHWTAAQGFTFTLTHFFRARLRNYRFPSLGHPLHRRPVDPVDPRQEVIEVVH